MKPCPACATALSNDATECPQPDCDWAHVHAKDVEDWTPDPPAQDTGVIVALVDVAKYGVTEGVTGFVLVLAGAGLGFWLFGSVGMAVGVVLGVLLFAASLLI